MPNDTKNQFLTELRRRFGHLQKLEHSNSLYDVSNGEARIYIRYSKMHARNSAFYGLRREDLQVLQGHPSVICFLCDEQREPLFIRFSDYEEVFHSLNPASDGQFKVQVYFRDGAAELYIAKAGRFNLEGQVGWNDLEEIVRSSGTNLVPDLSHWQVQTLLSAIGAMKGFDIWVPQNDRGRIDSAFGGELNFRDGLPPGFEAMVDVAEEIDVIWFTRGSNVLSGLFEVEHSTPIYSALLRFNDVHISRPSSRGNFQIVANDMRRSVFVRQLNRPTFRSSGLNELCGFLEYRNVFGWYKRLKGETAPT